ncbi:MAG: ferrochelatase [Gammaproteobacteria bacterium]|nr:ferrochelatase [Gammaproteobacteria bacterium]MBU1656165.1 ferrochelatase [Gammaproteobacteria bacterium]MBU1961298.1 ferrochelatase [Gammaproteobacteria bacterium]
MQTAPIGILLTNLGSPDAPEPAALRRYLAEFLSDRRVVDLSPLLWKPILHGIILNTRPKRSAAAYREVWTDAGAPLLDITRRQAEALRLRLAKRSPRPVVIEAAMRYGSPSLESGLDRLLDRGIGKLLVLPLYPQYAGATTASTFDQVARVLMSRRNLPEFHFIRSYPDHPGYIAALAASVREHQERHGRPDRLLISFHGIPRRYADAGDPYPQECETSARLLAMELGLSDDIWRMSYQSRFGREEWLKPYTDETLAQWGSSGVGHVQVICPGFAADCLETLEEIAHENRAGFLAAGGKAFSYIPALNDRADHVDALCDIILKRLES